MNITREQISFRFDHDFERACASVILDDAGIEEMERKLAADPEFQPGVGRYGGIEELEFTRYFTHLPTKAVVMTGACPDGHYDVFDGLMVETPWGVYDTCTLDGTAQRVMTLSERCILAQVMRRIIH